MELLSKNLLNEILSFKSESSPCLSLFMPTHRTHPQNQADPIKFKNLVKELEDSLLKKYSPDQTCNLIEPFKELIDQVEFWNHTPDGIAVLVSAGYFKVIGLQTPIDELAVVADSFHTKPLRHYIQTEGRYHVLGIGMTKMQLFEGNRHSLVKVVLNEDFPDTIEKALGEEKTEKHSTVSSHGGTGSGSSTMHHGHGGKMDEVDADTERFFRVISDRIYEDYSKPSGMPLILVALPEHHNLFHKVSKNPLLLKSGVKLNYQGTSEDKMTALTWDLMEAEYQLKQKEFAEKFEQAKANGKGSDEISEIARAAASGRVETLLIEADRIVPGKIINDGSGEIQAGDLNHPDTDDLLDDIGELVSRMAGDVMIVPKGSIAVKTGLAAIYRY